MPYYTFHEQWFHDHTPEFRMRLHLWLDERQRWGDFVRNEITGDRSVYDSNGSPTKIFTSRRAAEEYQAFLLEWNPPPVFTMQEWSDMDTVTAHLHTVRDPDFEGGVGPTEQEKAELRRKLGLDQVDKE
jgi:hypothetical protein